MKLKYGFDIGTPIDFKKVIHKNIVNEPLEELFNNNLVNLFGNKKEFTIEKNDKNKAYQDFFEKILNTEKSNGSFTKKFIEDYKYVYDENGNYEFDISKIEYKSPNLTFHIDKRKIN